MRSAKDIVFFAAILALTVADVVHDGDFHLDDLEFSVGAVAGNVVTLALPGAVLGSMAWYGTPAFRGKERTPDVRWFVVGGMVALRTVLGVTSD